METAQKTQKTRFVNDEDMFFIPALDLLKDEKALPVRDYSEIKGEVKKMLPFVDKEHEGTYSEAYAVSHAQVAKTPYAFFVVNTKLTKVQDPRLKFPHRVIINPEIIEAVENFMTPVGEQKELDTIDLGEGAECEVCHERICYCTWRQRSKENTLPIVKRLIQPRVRVVNRVRYDEACMSFQHRKPKKVERFSTITVRYQIPKMMGGLKTIEEKIDGLKAHIFQHEIDHSSGKNIYF